MIPVAARLMPRDTRERAYELLSARGIQRYLEGLGCRAITQFERKLLAVQEHIYYLDALGESTAWPRKIDLRDRWNAIIKKMQEHLRIPPRDAWKLTWELRVYQQLELARRERVSPWSLDLKRHYLLKTCDVRMQRRVCCLLLGRVPEILEERRWASFDLLTEILDDVDDRMEDRGTFNYNRFQDELAASGTAALQRYIACAKEIERDFLGMGGTKRGLVELFEEASAALHGKCELLTVREVA